MPAPLPRFATLAYCLPALGLGLLVLSLQLAAPRFYQEVHGLDLTTLAIIVLTVRLLDVLLAPVVGLASDRLRTRFGRRRPLLVVLVIPLAGGAAMTLDPVPGAGPVWFTLAFSLSLILTTAVAVNHEALGLDLIGGHDRRTRLWALRDGCFLLAALILVLTWNPLVPMARGWLSSWVPIAIPFTVISVLLCVRALQENRHSQEEVRSPPTIGQDLKAVMKSRTLLSLCGVHSLAIAGLAAQWTLAPAYLDEVVHLNGEDALPMALGCALAGLIVWALMAPRWEKLTGLRVALSIWIAAQAGWWILDVGDQGGLLQLAGLSGFATGGVLCMSSSLFADTPALVRRAHGHRLEGLHSGLWMSTRKVPAMAAAALALWALQRIGVGSEETASDASRKVLRTLFSAGPAAFGAIALATTYAIRLDRRLARSLDAALGD
jgi:Na+/melibiose symporter-like transporter